MAASRSRRLLAGVACLTVLAAALATVAIIAADGPPAHERLGLSSDMKPAERDPQVAAVKRELEKRSPVTSRSTVTSRVTRPAVAPAVATAPVSTESEGQFLVVGDHAFPDFRDWPSTGFIVEATGGDGVVILTGIQTGEVEVTVDVRTGPPPIIDTAGWDSVIEITLTPTGQLSVHELYTNDSVEELPVLNPAGAVPHRLRVHARGRDGDSQVDLEPKESYLLVAWPAPAAPGVVHKHTDPPKPEPLTPSGASAS